MVGIFAVMATKKFKRVYLPEWRKRAGVTQKQFARELGFTDVTVSRWESGTRRMDTDDLIAVASALSKIFKFPVEPQDLFRHPGTLSLDSMLRNAPDSLKRQAEALIRAIRGKDTPELPPEAPEPPK